jgi:tryptophanyl-tRNA synthetase
MRIFSGMRSSGKLHLGNYLGAAKNWVELQNKKDVEQLIFGVMDYHGITTPYDPKFALQQKMNVVLDYLATGVDPKKSLLIRQSKIPQHTELAWIFNTITPVSWLERLPTYKEKIEQTGNRYTNMGLLDYPVLMAADVLVYKADAVPVGDDQKQHVDLMNEIGKKFNSMFGETFPRVKHLKTKGERILSLKDPSKKMSKTGDEGISLTDKPDDVVKKIKSATTDSGSEITYDEKDKPGISNLLTIYHLLSDKTIDQLVNEYENKNYADFKSDLAEVVVGFLKPFQERRKTYSDNLDEVKKILETSEKKARNLAQETLTHVKAKMGIE